MLTIQLPEELEVLLEDAASSAGQSQGEYVRQLLSAHLEDESLPLSAFTETQLERMKESIAQVRRGEVFPSEHVDKMFEDWRQRRATR